MDTFRRYFPAVDGARWTYTCTTGDERTLTPMACSADRAFDGAHLPADAFAWTDPFDPGPANLTAYVFDDQGLSLCRLTIARELRARFDPPVPILRAPFVHGRRVDQVGIYQNEAGETGTGGEIRFSTQAEGPVVLELPAGRFEDCWIVTVHRSWEDQADSSRWWYAPDWGLVKAETLTPDGLLRTIELTCAKIGDREIGDLTKLLEVTAAAQDDGPAAAGPDADRPIGLGEVVAAIRPLNIDAQTIEGHKLAEIIIRGRCELVFRPVEAKAAAADDDTPAALPDTGLLWLEDDPKPADEAVEQGRDVRVTFFRTERAAKRIYGERRRAGPYTLVLHGNPVTVGADELEQRRRIAAKVAALVTHNTRRAAAPDTGEAA